MAEPLLEVAALTKRFGGIAALDGASLGVAQGELHALIGPNGAGKTTLVHQIAGALAPDAGTIRFAGRDVTRRPIHERVAAGIARSYQVTSVFDDFSVLENVALAVQARSGSSWRFWKPAIEDVAMFDEARGLLDRTGLGTRAGALAGELSHGEQRQLEIALALGTRPRLLLLDEPTAGMGPAETETMLGLLESLRGAVTIVLVEHDMDIVFRLADRITVLVGGRVVASGDPDRIRVDAGVRRAYLGEDA